MYRYFIQPQLNKFTKSLFGYEFLIRKFDDQHWILPEDFNAILVDVQAVLLQQTAGKLALKISSVSFNLNRTQFINPEMADALAKVQLALYPVRLIVEVTEEPTDKGISKAQVAAEVSYYDQHGIQISLDDVGSGNNTLANVESFLPLVHEIKFAMQNFRREGRAAEIPEQLVHWQKIADQYKLRFVVEGIETIEDDQLLDQLEIPYRQGYYYGKPHLSN